MHTKNTHRNDIEIHTIRDGWRFGSGSFGGRLWGGFRAKFHITVFPSLIRICRVAPGTSRCIVRIATIVVSISKVPFSHIARPLSVPMHVYEDIYSLGAGLE